MKQRIMLSMVALTWGLFAQQAQQEKHAQRIFEIKHADVNRIAGILETFGSVRRDSNLRIITFSGSAEVIPAIEQMIKKMDVPQPAPKNVELTFHILQASPEPAGSKLPSELEPVIKQLKATFPYQGFRLVETLLLRARDGNSANVSAVAPGPSEPTRTTIQLSVGAARISESAQPQVVRIDDLKFGMRVPIPTGPNNYSLYDAGLITNIDVREGQKVVVGKANMQGSDGALFLIVTAKVVD
jgi:hypothetical protein